MVLMLLDDLCAALLPPRCAACGARGVALCDRCAADLRAAPPAPPPVPIDCWTACFSYEGAGRELVARAKYRGERAALREVGGWLATAARGAPARVQLVTWAPASATRLARTGVDH